MCLNSHKWGSTQQEMVTVISKWSFVIHHARQNGTALGLWGSPSQCFLCVCLCAGSWSMGCERRLFLGQYFSAPEDHWLSSHFYHSCADREQGGRSRSAIEARACMAELYLQQGGQHTHTRKDWWHYLLDSASLWGFNAEMAIVNLQTSNMR